jgi:ABC-type antimicrobial peptide transport system permease subunit
MVAGMPVALLITQLVRHAFFGVRPHDPPTVIGSVIVLLSVAVLAAWIPARRAARIDPMEALRYE